MKQHTYVLASQTPEKESLWNFLQHTRNILLAKGVPHQIPKLGWHLTHITPFEATQVETVWFLLGLLFGSTLYSHSNPRRIIRTTGFDFFDGPNESKSLVLRLETDEDFREKISHCRSVIQQLTSVRFPAKNFQANFHVTVAEWIPPGAITRRRKLWKQILESHKVPIVTEVEPPKLYMKEPDAWVPVVV